MAEFAAIESMTDAQLVEQLATFYGVSASPQSSREALEKELTRCRETKVITHGLTYGPTLTLGNTKNPTGVVTLSHGLGDSARGWEDVGHEFAQRLPHLMFVLPTAPVARVSINNGAKMNSWYDIMQLGDVTTQNVDEVFRSALYLQSLAAVTAKKYTIDPRRVVYAGFSQGCAISLIAGLTARTPPAGIVAMSGYFVSALANKVRHTSVPISMHHGTIDDIVPLKLAQRSKEELAKIGVTNVELSTYRMPHSAVQDEIDNVADFLAKVLP